MADSFTLLREDRFSSFVIADISPDAGGIEAVGNVDTQKAIRRPLLGMEHKREKYAVLRVISSDISKLQMINTSAPQSDVDAKDGTKVHARYNSNLLIQSIQESREEKSQVIQTFGDDFVYFFGERPVQIQISAQLLDSNNFRWHQEWWENYSSILRGTEAVRRDARVYLEIQDIIYEGYITRAGTVKSADNPRMVALNFTMLVTNKIYLRVLQNRYENVQLPGRSQLDNLAKETLRVSHSTQLSAAENSLSALKSLAQNIKQGVPALGKNKVLSLESALLYVDPADRGSTNVTKETVTDTIKRVSNLYGKMFDSIIASQETPFYTSSIGEYPNRGVEVVSPPTSSKTVVSKADFIRLQSIKFNIFKGSALPTEKKITKKSLNGIKIEDLFLAQKDTIGKDGGKFSAPYISRGVYPLGDDLSFLEGKAGTLANIDNFLGKVENFLGTVAQYGLVVANLYMAYLAGQALVESIDDFFNPKSFGGSITTEPVTFEEVRDSTDDTQPVFNDSPSGSSSSYDPVNNPTPYRDDGDLGFLGISDEDEVVYVEPDFSIFRDNTTSGSTGILILE